MSFEFRGEAVIGAHELSELKLIYAILHTQLAKNPELMDTHFLTELQSFLQRAAAADGVDATHHAAWDAWLSAR